MLTGLTGLLANIPSAKRVSYAPSHWASDSPNGRGAHNFSMILGNTKSRCRRTTRLHSVTALDGTISRQVIFYVKLAKASEFQPINSIHIQSSRPRRCTVAFTLSHRKTRQSTSISQRYNSTHFIFKLISAQSHTQHQFIKRNCCLLYLQCADPQLSLLVLFSSTLLATQSLHASRNPLFGLPEPSGERIYPSGYIIEKNITLHFISVSYNEPKWARKPFG